MQIPLAEQPPANEAPLAPDGAYTQAWLAWFQAVSDTFERLLPTGTIYANDAAAAAGGVPLGGLYFNGSIFRARLV